MSFFNLTYKSSDKFTSSQQKFVDEVKASDVYLENLAKNSSFNQNLPDNTFHTSDFSFVSTTINTVIGNIDKEIKYSVLVTFSPNALVEAALIVRDLIYKTQDQINKTPKESIFNSFLEGTLSELNEKQALIANRIYENHLKPSKDKKAISEEMKAKIRVNPLPSNMTQISKINPLFDPKNLNNISIMNFMEQYTKLYSTEYKKVEGIYVASIDPKTLNATEDDEFESHLKHKIAQCQQSVIMVGTEMEVPTSESLETTSRETQDDPIKEMFDRFTEEFYAAGVTIFTSSTTPSQRIENLFNRLKVWDSTSITFDSFQIKKSNQESEKLSASKIFLVYAQIHKIATENPEKIIQYDFFTDTDSTEGKKLAEVFTNNPQLIPANMMVTFIKKEINTAPIVINSISGTGIIDKNYQTTVETGLKQTDERKCINWLSNRLNMLNNLEKLSINSTDESPEKIMLISGIEIIKNSLQTNLGNEKFELTPEEETLYHATVLFIELAINPLLAEKIPIDAVPNLHSACDIYIAMTKSLVNPQYKKIALDLHKKTLEILPNQLQKQKNEKFSELLQELPLLKENYVTLSVKNTHLKSLVESVKINWPTEEAEEFEEGTYQEIFNKFKKINSDYTSIEKKLEDIKKSEDVNLENLYTLANSINSYQQVVFSLEAEIDTATIELMRIRTKVNLNKYINQLQELKDGLEESKNGIDQIKRIDSLEDKTIVTNLENDLKIYQDVIGKNITICKENIEKLDSANLLEEIEKINADINNNLGSIKLIKYTFLPFNNLVTETLLLTEKKLLEFQKKQQLSLEETNFRSKIENNLNFLEEKIVIANKKMLDMNSLATILRSRGWYEYFLQEFNKYQEVNKRLQGITKQKELLLSAHKKERNNPILLETLEKRNQEIVRLANETEILTNSLTFDEITKSYQSKIEETEKTLKKINRSNVEYENEIAQITQTLDDTTLQITAKKTEATKAIQSLGNKINNLTSSSVAGTTESWQEVITKQLSEKEEIKVNGDKPFIPDFIDSWLDSVAKFIQNILAYLFTKGFKSTSSSPLKNPAKEKLKELINNIPKGFNKDTLDELTFCIKDPSINLDEKEKNLLTNCVNTLTTLNKLINTKNDLEEKKSLYEKCSLLILKELNEAKQLLTKLAHVKMIVQSSINMISDTPQVKLVDEGIFSQSMQSAQQAVKSFGQSATSFFSKPFPSASNLPPSEPANSPTESNGASLTNSENANKKTP